MRAFPKRDVVLNTKLLFVDELYQRELKMSAVKDIVRNFNPNLVNKIKVSLRGGKYWVFDGQTTMAALIERNGGKDLPVECTVYYEMTWLDEVALFLAQHGHSRPVYINDRLRAMFNAGDPEVVDMVRTAEKVGLIIDFKNQKGDNKIVALSTLLKAYKTMTHDQYEGFLKLLKDTWGGSKESLCREMIQGHYLVYMTYEPMLDKKRYIKKLGQVSPIAIIRDGRVSSAPGASKYARQILGYYNRGCRDRLPDLL